MDQKEINPGADRVKLDKLNKTLYGQRISDLRSSIAEAIEAYRLNKQIQNPKNDLVCNLLESFLNKNPIALASVILDKLREAQLNCDKSWGVDKSLPEQLERILKNPRYQFKEFYQFSERDLFEFIDATNSEEKSLNAAAVELVKTNLGIQEKEVRRLDAENRELREKLARAEEKLKFNETRVNELTQEVYEGRQKIAKLEDKNEEHFGQYQEAVANMTLLTERLLNQTVLPLENDNDSTANHQPFDETTKIIEEELLKHITPARLKAVLILAKHLKDHPKQTQSMLSASNPLNTGALIASQAYDEVVEFIMKLGTDNSKSTVVLITDWCKALKVKANAPAFNGLIPQLKSIEDDSSSRKNLDENEERKYRYFYQLFTKGKKGQSSTSLQNDDLSKRFRALRKEAQPKSEETHQRQQSHLQ